MRGSKTRKTAVSALALALGVALHAAGCGDGEAGGGAADGAADVLEASADAARANGTDQDGPDQDGADQDGADQDGADQDGGVDVADAFADDASVDAATDVDDRGAEDGAGDAPDASVDDAAIDGAEDGGVDAEGDAADASDAADAGSPWAVVVSTASAAGYTNGCTIDSDGNVYDVPTGVGDSTVGMGSVRRTVIAPAARDALIAAARALSVSDAGATESINPPFHLNLHSCSVQASSALGGTRILVFYFEDGANVHHRRTITNNDSAAGTINDILISVFCPASGSAACF
jgi:hypothetical protein